MDWNKHGISLICPCRCSLLSFVTVHKWHFRINSSIHGLKGLYPCLWVLALCASWADAAMGGGVCEGVGPSHTSLVQQVDAESVVYHGLMLQWGGEGGVPLTPPWYSRLMLRVWSIMGWCCNEEGGWGCEGVGPSHTSLVQQVDAESVVYHGLMLQWGGGGVRGWVPLTPPWYSRGGGCEGVGPSHLTSPWYSRLMLRVYLSRLMLQSWMGGGGSLSHPYWYAYLHFASQKYQWFMYLVRIVIFLKLHCS